MEQISSSENKSSKMCGGSAKEITKQWAPKILFVRMN